MRVVIRKPFDAHVHLRDGDMLRAVAPVSASYCARALVMPNAPAVHTGDEAMEYKRQIAAAAGDACEWLMSIKLTHRTTPGDIVRARDVGVVSGKLYPDGATTASHDGIRDVESLSPVFRAMRDCGMVLCVHAEEPDEFVLDREPAYLPKVAWVVGHFPGLKVVVEHISTAAAVEFVRSQPASVGATITAHHLCRTLDAVVGGLLNPHEFCKPIPKRPSDRDALIRAATLENSGKFMFGSDSAPHPRSAKESACGCAGVYSAPVALPVLADVFLGDAEGDRDLRGRRDALERFTSVVGAEFYGLPRNEGSVTLGRADWRVPESCPAGGEAVIPFRAGETLRWEVVEHTPRED